MYICFFLFLECLLSYNSVSELVNIDDSALSSSSIYSSSHHARFSRLHSTAGEGSWSSAHNSVGEWIQATIGEIKVIVKVATQGQNMNHDQYVTSYKLSTSTDGIAFEYVLELDGSQKIFPANYDTATVVENCVDYVQARFVRLEPQTWYMGMSLRWEIMTLHIEGYMIRKSAFHVKSGIFSFN